MIKTIYIVILVYFFLGGLGFYFINRKKNPQVAQNSYTKFGVYFIIINALFFSIVIDSTVFRYISVLIILVGFFEMLKLYKVSGFRHNVFFVAALLVFVALSIGFFFFSGLSKELILFSFLVLSIFDSFSQITGQLFGKQKILPNISPNKTLGGLVGGAVIATASALLFSKLYSDTHLYVIITSAGIVVFAFAGDVLASLYKRKYDAKDYSKLIPGHGGFLDRFDSLIAGGAWVTFSIYVLGFH